ncbi:MAG: DUF1476 domain-containing protein [Rhodobacteraceae bacterium]|nr:DUF1476 domain-containing protein [Paracoccaceae bacterium]
MRSFEDRKKTQETKHVHDEEMRFKAAARTNKLLGLWAAELLGKSQEAAAGYAKSLVLIDFEAPGPENVIAKVIKDLAGRASEQVIRAKFEELQLIAQEQIASERQGASGSAPSDR